MLKKCSFKLLTWKAVNSNTIRPLSASLAELLRLNLKKRCYK
jgi:hypothetical protein